MLGLNCCGIKNKLQYPAFEYVLRSNDILCLIETKTDDLDEINLMGYTFKMQNREKVKTVKSGGIILGYKDCLDAFIEPIDTDCKFVLWC